MAGGIRLAAAQDAGALAGIYAPYVRDSAVTFEIEPPGVEEFARRIETIGSQYPYLVYAAHGKPVGYAYAYRQRERAAYAYNVETSIYIAGEYQGMGVGRRLYECLFAMLGELGYRNAYAGYTIPHEQSRRFHEKMGFTHIGTYHKTGYKLGRWWDVAWMEKTIQEHGEPGAVKGMGELEAEFLKELFRRFA